MRCKNCHTALMETDLVCPCCRASRARATAAPPAASEEPNGLLMMLPIFGGALGGLLYAGISAAQATAQPATPATPAESPHYSGRSWAWSPVKRLFGVVLLVAGILFLVLAVVHACDTWNIAHRQPTVATAAELCRPDALRSAGDWIEYTFAESKPTELTVTRQRLGIGGDVEAQCLLVRAGDRWLLATVAPNFDGDQLVGRLVPYDASTPQVVRARLQKRVPNGSALLPYEFNAVDGSVSDQRVRYAAAAWLAVFALVGLWGGRKLIRSAHRAARRSAVLADAARTYRPPSRGHHP